MAIAQGRVEALDAATAELDPSRIGTCNCADDDKRPRISDIHLATALSQVHGLRDMRASPRFRRRTSVTRANGKSFGDRASERPADKALVPGIIGSTSKFV